MGDTMDTKEALAQTVGQRMTGVPSELDKELRKVATRVLQSKYGLSVSIERSGGRQRSSSYKKAESTIFRTKIKEISMRPIQEQSCVPNHIKALTEHLERGDRLLCEGLYRRNGRFVAINTLVESLDRGVLPDLEEVGTHEAAGTVKKWLRELPEPVIPAAWQETFLNACNHDYGALSLATMSLPQHNREVLEFFVLHLVRVVEAQTALPKDKRMTAKAIGIVFGQCLLQQSKTSDSKMYNTLHPIASAPNVNLAEAESLENGPADGPDLMAGFAGQAKLVEKLVEGGVNLFKVPESIKNALAEEDALSTPSTNRRRSSVVNKVLGALQTGSVKRTDSPAHDVSMHSPAPSMLSLSSVVTVSSNYGEDHDDNDGDGQRLEDSGATEPNPDHISRRLSPVPKRKAPLKKNSHFENARIERYKQQLVFGNTRRKRSDTLEGAALDQLHQKSSKRRQILAEMSARMGSTPAKGQTASNDTIGTPRLERTESTSEGSGASDAKKMASVVMEGHEDQETENLVQESNRKTEVPVRTSIVKRASLTDHITNAGIKANELRKRVVRRISGQLKRRTSDNLRSPASASKVLRAEEPAPAHNKRRRSMQMVSSSWQALMPNTEGRPEDSDHGPGAMPENDEKEAAGSVASLEETETLLDLASLAKAKTVQL